MLRGAWFLVTYTADVPSEMRSARRLTASTVFPVPGPPLTTMVLFLPPLTAFLAESMIPSNTIFCESIMTNSRFPFIIDESTSWRDLEGLSLPLSIMNIVSRSSPFFRMSSRNRFSLRPSCLANTGAARM